MLCVTCKYLILTELEKQRRELRNKDNYRKALEIEIATAAAEDMALDQQQDQLGALGDCVGKLPQETASVVELRYFAKRSCKEIAAEKDRSVTWVTSTLSRVRKALRACLQAQAEEALS